MRLPVRILTNPATRSVHNSSPSQIQRSIATNPFSTRRTQPGAIPYHFADGTTPSALVERFKQQDWVGQIIGPHGSGKSTLVHILIDALKHANQLVVSIVLKQGQRALPPGTVNVTHLAPSTILIIDGFEQLSWLHRWRIRFICWRRKLGLLITAHRSFGLPTIWRNTTSIETTQELVQQLAGHNTISPDEVAEWFRRCGGNVREVFFHLYDAYERNGNIEYRTRNFESRSRS